MTTQQAAAHIAKLRHIARRYRAPIAQADQTAAALRDSLTNAGIDLDDPARRNAVLATSAVFTDCLLASGGGWRTAATDRCVHAWARTVLEVADCFCRQCDTELPGGRHTCGGPA